MIKKKQPYELLEDYVMKNPKRGMTIPHSDIANIMGITYVRGEINNKYSYHISKANKNLTRKNLRLKSIIGFGYRIIENNEYAEEVQKYYTRASHSLDKAFEIGNGCKKSTLTTLEKNEFNLQMNNVKEAQTFLANQTKTLINSNSNSVPKYSLSNTP